MRLLISAMAKREATRALLKRMAMVKSKRFGISEAEARKLGIKSGVERAKELMRKKYLTLQEAKKVAAFHQRFKNCRTPKCEGAIDLWGGRTFGKKVISFVKKNR